MRHSNDHCQMTLLRLTYEAELFAVPQRRRFDLIEDKSIECSNQLQTVESINQCNIIGRKTVIDWETKPFIQFKLPAHQLYSPAQYNRSIKIADLSIRKLHIILLLNSLIHLLPNCFIRACAVHTDLLEMPTKFSRFSSPKFIKKIQQIVIIRPTGRPLQVKRTTTLQLVI